MQCPGQDSQYWTEDAIYDVDCPKCEAAVEFYKDDTTRKCPKCGHRFVNPRLDFGCAAYCQFAEQCIGDLPEDFVAGQESLLKDKVAVEMKRFFKSDFKRIGHATRIARHVEQISQEEGGNTPVLLCCAYIQEMADSAGTTGEESGASSLAEETLNRLKASEPMIDCVLAMLRGDGETSGKDTDILEDARTLARLEESFKTDPEGTSAVAGQKVADLLTSSGKLIGQAFIEKAIPT